MGTLPELPADAVEAFEKALELMGDLAEGENEPLMRQIVDQLALAVAKAGGVFPTAQAFLAFSLVEIDPHKAFSHAQQALRYDLEPLAEFLARVAYASGYGLVHGEKALSRLQWFKGGGFIDFLGTKITFESFKNNVLAAYRGVIDSYERILREEDDLEVWIWASHLMIVMGDGAEENNLLRGKLDFYSPVIRARWSKVAPEGDPLVQEVVDLARARLVLRG